MFVTRRFIKSVINVGISEIENELIVRCNPKTKVKTVRFEPIKIPKRRENLFLLRQEADREYSGNVVPKDKIVAPIMDSEIPIFFAMSEERTTEILAVIITIPNPKQTKAKSLIRFVFHINPLLVRIILLFTE